MNRVKITVAAAFAAVLLVACGKPSDQATVSPVASDSTEVVPVDTTGSMLADSLATAADTTTAMAASTTTVNKDQQDDKMPETSYYEIKTPKGRMVIRLYDETPIHRDNFRKLVSEGYYDGTTFHRVIEGFMIQGGDGLSKDDNPLNDGAGEIGYTLEAEFQPGLFHKRGALAAARQGDQVNPERRSSGSQFYIVHGTVSTAEELTQLEQQMKAREPGFQLSDAAKTAYSTDGGVPFLDGQYTVFGELVDGFDVLDAIAATETPRKKGERVNPAIIDRPADAIRMEVRPLTDYPS
jgi:peptidyl-prolyl cis-trans isomerase B (cyclophilin B)